MSESDVAWSMPFFGTNEKGAAADKADDEAAQARAKAKHCGGSDTEEDDEQQVLSMEEVAECQQDFAEIDPSSRMCA